MIYKRIVSIILLGIVVVVVALASLSSARAISNSKIVFTESVGGDNQIFTMFPDGTDVTHVGTGAGAQISPDGGQIVYMSYNNPLTYCGADRSVPNSNIYVMNADGSNVRNLTASMPCTLYVTSSWSPDGTKIAYTVEGTPGTSSSLQQGIHIMNADGSGDTYLSVFGFPAWSPDGSELAYANSTLHLINTDGSNNRDLGVATNNAQPAWSPDGNEIAFLNNNGISTIKPDGSSQTVIYSGQPEPTSIGWSPDGTRLAFAMGGAVYTIGSSGNNPQQIYRDPSGTCTFTSWGRYNAPISIGSVSVSPNPVTINTAVSSSASFTYSNPSDSHKAEWDWGDGTTSSGTVSEQNGSGTVTGNHTYTASGVYAVILTITNASGVSASQEFDYLSAYNPTLQGLFSAGSHFSSPAGAYTQDPSLSGNAEFGLSYKYKGTVPTSDRQFSMNFNAVNFQFNATTVNALVIANGVGTLNGTGTINNTGTYNFLVTGSETNNTIRIQISDQSGNVIYDTQPGAAATALPMTAVNGKVNAH